MDKQKLGLTLFWIVLLYAVVFGGIATWSIAQTLRTHTFEEVGNTIWALDKPLFILWAFSVPLGALLACVGALLYVKTKKSLVLLTGIGVLGVVFIMTFFLGKIYYPPIFGILGTLILLSFFAILWLWMKKQKTLDEKEKIASSFKLTGYLFFIIATWFICGEFGSLYQKAFEGRLPSSPIEIIVYLALGWLFLLIGHYKETQAIQE